MYTSQKQKRREEFNPIAIVAIAMVVVVFFLFSFHVLFFSFISISALGL